MADKTPTPLPSLADLTVEDAEAPQRMRNTGPNPMQAHFDASTTAKGPKAVTVKGSQVAEVEALLRRAAAERGLGVQISFPSKIEEYEAKDRATGGTKTAKRRVVNAKPGDDVRVVFLSKPKRKVTETAETVPAE